MTRIMTIIGDELTVFALKGGVIQMLSLCASTFDTANPVRKVQRHIKGNQPLRMANYTVGMSGVEMWDRLMSEHGPQIKEKNWW